MFCVLTSMLGLAGLAYLAWATRHGHPRGPAGAIVAGFILYSSLTIRLIAGLGLVLFKPAQAGATRALIAWGLSMVALWWMELPLTTSARVSSSGDGG